MLTIIMLAMSVALVSSSCSRKSGCPVNEDAHVKPGKNGSYSSKKGKSELFPKEMRKKMKQ